MVSQEIALFSLNLSKNAPRRPPGAQLGLSWGPLGGILAPLGPLLGSSWPLWGPSLAHLGPLGPLLGLSWPLLAPLGLMLAPLGPFLGSSKPLWGSSWAHLGPNWARLGPILAHLGANLVPREPILHPSWPKMTPRALRKTPGPSKIVGCLRLGLRPEGPTPWPTLRVVGEFCGGPVGSKLLAETLAAPLAGNSSSTAPSSGVKLS